MRVIVSAQSDGLPLVWNGIHGVTYFFRSRYVGVQLQAWQ
jgi:hypothetical protein